jgi:glycosyltransferase involved in cell wall biosynthesis
VPALRIAVVAPPWYEVPPPGYGGIERLCFELVQHLVARQHDVTLVAVGENHTGANFVQVLDRPLTGLGGIEQPVQEVRYAVRVARAMAGLPVDIVHDHSLAGPLASADRTAPTLVTVHGPTDGPLGDYYRHLGSPLVAISDYQRRAGPDLPWIGTVHNSVDVPRYPFHQDKERFVLFVGRMSPEKGVHLVPDAARAAGIPAVIAAKCSEPDERRYFERDVEPRLGPETTWLGEIGEARRNELLGRARCVLLPVQWDEPFGLVTVEAMACGTPVVALARGSMPEIVEHGRTGFVCHDPAELPEAIRRAAEIDPAECRRRALRHFDTTVMAAGYERAYRRVLAADR